MNTVISFNSSAKYAFALISMHNDTVSEKCMILLRASSFPFSNAVMRSYHMKVTSHNTSEN